VFFDEAFTAIWSDLDTHSDVELEGEELKKDVDEDRGDVIGKVSNEAPSLSSGGHFVLPVQSEDGRWKIGRWYV
jgi:hypothetical protein